MIYNHLEKFMKFYNLTDFRINYFLASLFLLVCLTACEQKSTGANNTLNVLIVTFDTTRADHIASYNLKADAYTPNLDKLTNDGVLYEHNLVPIPITLPSHSSIMTGKVPFVHGVRDNGLFNLPQQQLTLAEILKDKGWQTGAAIGSFPLTSKFGINQGFDFYNDHITQKYEDVFGDRTIPKEALFFDERTSAQVNDAILPWLDENTGEKSDKPFFAWVHYFDPHHPHEPPAPYNQSFIHDLYQGEIAFADESFGNIIAKLKQTGEYDNTLIIFTSDHGEGNGEHNESTHSMLIYNTTLHVPLIIKYPNQQYAGSRVKQWVASVDIFPTALSILGIDIPDDIQGAVLPTENSKVHKEIYAETLSPRFSRGWGEQRGIIKNGYKYIYGPQKELYNLNDDPHEVKNLIKNKPELAQSMQADLQEYIDEYRVTDADDSSLEVDAKTLNTLRGLGYIQSSAGSVEKFEEKLDDSGDAPQLHVDTIATYSIAKQMLFQGKYFEAIRYLDALLLTDANNLAYLELKAQADINLGNYDSAKQVLENMPAELYGTITPAKRLTLLANINLYQGDIIDAKFLFEDAENLEQTISGQYQLAKIAKNKQDLVSQQHHLENILKIDATLVKIIDELDISYAQDGNLFQSEKSFLNSINNNPYNHKSYYNYGVFLNSISDFQTSQAQFEKAIKLKKNYFLAHYALIETLVALNKIEQAKKAYNNLKNIAPLDAITKKAEQLLTTL